MEESHLVGITYGVTIVNNLGTLEIYVKAPKHVKRWETLTQGRKAHQVATTYTPQNRFSLGIAPMNVFSNEN